MVMWRNAPLLVAALLVGIAGAGCSGPDSAALKKGRAAESRGDWSEAKRQYAAAITMGSGKGFQQMAELLVRHDAAELFSEDAGPRDGRWISAAESLTGQIRHSVKEAARRGHSAKGAEKALEGYMAAIQEAKEKAAGAAHSMTDLAELQARHQRLQSALSALAQEVAMLERQVKECDSDLEEVLMQNFREGEKLYSEVQDLFADATRADDAAMRWGENPYDYWNESQSPSAAAQEIGIRMGLQRQVAAQREKRIREEKAQLETRLAERRQELAGVKEQLEACEKEIALRQQK